MNNIRQIIAVIIQMQYDLNSKINKEWCDAGNDWFRAMWTEAAEAIMSTAWKWWKKESVDWSNIKVELIDIFHFLLSASINHAHNNWKEGDIDPLATAALKFNNGFTEGFNHATDMTKMAGTLSEGSEPSPEDLERFRRLLETFVAENLGQRDIKHMFHLFGQLWATIGLTFDDIAKEYMVKNTLNVFRQDNGYKTGEYIKEWSATGDEDNVFAFNKADAMTLTSDFPKQMYEYLTAEYGRVKKDAELALAQ